MSWNKVKEKEGKDNFWMGFIPSFLIPPIMLIIIFKVKYTTSRPLFEVMYEFSKTGLMGTDVLSSTLLCFVLLFVFSKLKKERATMGTFVGACPFIILSFWIM